MFLGNYVEKRKQDLINVQFSMLNSQSGEAHPRGLPELRIEHRELNISQIGNDLLHCNRQPPVAPGSRRCME
jgi:hypothetical protein